MPSKVAVRIDDLFFRARVDAAARALGTELVTVGAEGAGLDGVRGCVLDLEQPGALEFLDAATAHDPRPQLVGYLSHVRTDLAEEARRRGCDEVLPRSAFTQRLPELLAGLASSE